MEAFNMNEEERFDNNNELNNSENVENEVKNDSVEAEIATKEDTNKPQQLDEINGDYNRKNENNTNANAFYKPLTYVNDGTRTIDEDIERIRKSNMSKMNSSKIFDIISLVVMIIAFAGVVLITLLNKSGNKALTYSVVGVAIALVLGCFFLSSLLNKKKSKVVNEYLDQYEDATYSYVFSAINVTKGEYCLAAKIEDLDVINAHYFNTINAIQSRAAVIGKRNGLDFHGAEVAVSIPSVAYTVCNSKPEDLINLDGSTYNAQTCETMTGTQEFATKDMTAIDLNVASDLQGNKKVQNKREKDIYKATHKTNQPSETSTGFFGKFFAYDMKVHSSEALIISFMGDKEYTVLPDYLTGYQAIKVPGLRSNIVVYATDIKSSAVFFDETSIKILNEVTPDYTVQSAFLSVNSYGTKVGVTLSDEIMSLPIKEMKHIGTFDSYKNAVANLFKFVDYIDEKRMK